MCAGDKERAVVVVAVSDGGKYVLHFKNITLAIEDVWKLLKILLIEVQARQSYGTKDKKKRMNLRDI